MSPACPSNPTGAIASLYQLTEHTQIPIILAWHWKVLSSPFPVYRVCSSSPRWQLWGNSPKLLQSPDASRRPTPVWCCWGPHAGLTFSSGRDLRTPAPEGPSPPGHPSRTEARGHFCSLSRRVLRPTGRCSHRHPPWVRDSWRRESVRKYFSSNLRPDRLSCLTLLPASPGQLLLLRAKKRVHHLLPQRKQRHLPLRWN